MLSPASGLSLPIAMTGAHGYDAFTMRTRTNRLFRIARPMIVVGSVLFLNACLTVEIDIAVHSTSHIDVTAKYTVDQELYDLGVFDADTPYRTVPVTENDARRIADSIENAHLRSYKSEMQEDVYNIEIQYRVSSPEALEELFGGQGFVRMTYSDASGAGASGTLTVMASRGTSNSMVDQGLRDDEVALMQQLFGDASATVTMRTPEPITGISGGAETDKNTARFSALITDLLQSSEPVVWRTEW